MPLRRLYLYWMILFAQNRLNGLDNFVYSYYVVFKVFREQKNRDVSLGPYFKLSNSFFFSSASK